MRVFVTGGAGYLGRGLLRRVYGTDDPAHPADPALTDWQATVYSRDETKQDECRQRYPLARYVLGDVRDADHLYSALVGHDYVIHAAALKYIPEAELNAAECVAINVDGSRNVIKAARQAGVLRVVAISTDKACQPVNVYGASKMIMERLIADQPQWSHPGGPLYTAVRYGNVVGSTGSVIPLFQRQYADSGVVRVTDPGMTRFWMGIDEAIDLILAGLTADNGSVVVPLTRAMTIVDVARAATVDNVHVDVIGTRPGEKTHETLVHFSESVRARRGKRGDLYYVELLPPGGQIEGTVEAFTMASHTPNHHLSVQQMRELIADAATI